MRKMLSLAAAGMLALTACEQGPMEPPQALNSEGAGSTFVPPAPEKEHIDLCKAGPDRLYNFDVSGDAPVATGNYDLPANTCVRLSSAGGPRYTATIVENVPAGFVVDSIVVQQLFNGVVTTTKYTETNQASGYGQGGATTLAGAVITFYNSQLPPPPPPAGVCEGGVDRLVVKYVGTTPLNGTVRGQRRNPGTSPILDGIVVPAGAETHYLFAITSRGGQFTPVANGRLANNFKLFINGTEIVDFHTSCSAPIHPGMRLGPAARQFEIVSVSSVNGGEIGAP